MQLLKTCTRCKIPKSASDFRIRIERYKNNTYELLNSTCRKCDTELATIYYNKHKNNPAFKRKNRERVKLYNTLNPERVKATQKNKRDKPDSKIRRVQYDKKNKERIAWLSKLRNKKYVKRIVTTLDDQYIISTIRTESYRKTGNCRIVFTKVQINKKRKSILEYRIKKLIKQLDNEKQD